MHIYISIGEQKLRLFEGDALVAEYVVSSAANGIGFEEGSYCTPTGRFEVSEKIGDGEALGRSLSRASQWGCGMEHRVMTI